MRTLLSKTIDLLHRHPILWLPALLAEFATFLLHWLVNPLQRYLSRQLLLWLTESHSVLGGAAEHVAPSGSTLVKLNLLSFPIAFGTEFLGILFSAAALVATAALLRSLAESRPATLPAALPQIAASRRRIVHFALTLLGLNIVSECIYGFATPIFMPLVSTLQSGIEHTFLLSIASSMELEKLNLIGNLVSHLWVLPVVLCIAWLIAPLQARLTQPSGSALTPPQAMQARIATILATLTLSLLSFLISMLLAMLFQSDVLPASLAIHFAIGVVRTLLTSLPLALLYIALTLIAAPSIACIPTSAPTETTPPGNPAEDPSDELRFDPLR
jgi:hypothetical protein